MVGEWFEIEGSRTFTSPLRVESRHRRLAWKGAPRGETLGQPVLREVFAGPEWGAGWFGWEVAVAGRLSCA